MAGPSTTMKRRGLDFADLDEVAAELRRLSAGGYRRAGNWDLSQTCRHLTGAIHGCIDGVEMKVALPVRVIARFLVKGLVLGSGWMRAGVPAPQGIVFGPDPSVDDAAAIEAFAAAAARLRGHDGPWHPHPYFGPLNGAEWKRFHIVHANHHLGFLIPAAT